MLTGNITLSPLYLPWQQQGLDFLLQDTPVAPELSLCHAKVLTRGAIQQTPQWAPQNAPRQFAQQVSKPVAQQQAGQSTASRPMPRAQSSQASPAQGQSTPVSQSNATPPPATSKSNAGRVSLALDQWPAPWQERFAQTKPARVIWTYWNLGHDLCGESSAERRAFLKRILQDLKHPPGTHSFWPHTLPDLSSPEQLQPNIPVFWSGVRQLGARVLVILGEGSAQKLGYDAFDAPFKEFHKQGKLVILVKDMDMLMHNTKTYTTLMQYLRIQLRQYLQLM